MRPPAVPHAAAKKNCAWDEIPGAVFCSFPQHLQPEVVCFRVVPDLRTASGNQRDHGRQVSDVRIHQNRDPELCERAEQLGREWVIQVTGKVIERYSKNKNIPTGDIEIDFSCQSALRMPKTVRSHASRNQTIPSSRYRSAKAAARS